MPICGDGLIAGNEACDDGNTVSGDGCSASCQLEAGCVPPSCVVDPTCGDGVPVTPQEGCDDGNTMNGDGCSAVCAPEAGFHCSSVPAQPSICLTMCGDGIKAGAEQCDDGNTVSGDGCSSGCQIEP